ncbi:hypothetical protein [Vagococcus sp.]|uniref:lectin-like domain-containing protein n=1 Tax=Vagococcus sp. TaxID=1933889 RepID=UPI000ECC1A82|nr:hypothetical protein [Vagococcus sp.]HCT95523.1 hypothetical protein [Vagococcus sp.]
MINLNEPFILEFYGYFGNTECGGSVSDGLALSFRNGRPIHAGYKGAVIGVYGDGLGQKDALGIAHLLEFNSYYNIFRTHLGDVRDQDVGLKNHLKKIACKVDKRLYVVMAITEVIVLIVIIIVAMKLRKNY